MNCPNCGTKHGCGCQARKASNGANCCSSCINSYEARLTSLKTSGHPAPANNTQLGKPTDPSNISVSIHRR